MFPPTSSSAPVLLRPRGAMSTTDLEAANRLLEFAEPTDIVAWAVAQFGRRLAVAASFADTLLIDIASKVDADIEIVFLDTGFHFPETLETVRRAMDRYELRLTVLRPDADSADLWADEAEACCASRKSDPLAQYLRSNVDGWLSGLRRADDPGRASTPIVTLDNRGLVKVNPLAAMTDEDVDAYIADRGVLVNPLVAQGYASIGCWPCTVPSSLGRGGRWAGSAKTECGLHL